MKKAPGSARGFLMIPDCYVLYTPAIFKNMTFGFGIILSNYIAHGIYTWLFSLQKLCCLDSALCKYTSGECLMVQFDYLVLSCVNYIMYAYDGSTSDC